ncbi:hypothetical protein LCGC14_2271800 [marine sediment metagenome]|uniref:Uncharacterized protein n=1 Tax=marine sediment metagenome TaxID=412755 RepID=A0A0F9FRY7_9ZZZZ
MKILASKDFNIPLRFNKLVVRWCRGFTEVLKPGIRFHGKAHCEQKIMFDHPHIVDRAHIVQLSATEAEEIGLITALGVIQGKKHGLL